MRNLTSSPRLKLRKLFITDNATLDIIKKDISTLEANMYNPPFIMAFDETKLCRYCYIAGVHYYRVQIRGADEPESSFFICRKCNKGWREG